MTLSSFLCYSVSSPIEIECGFRMALKRVKFAKDDSRVVKCDRIRAQAMKSVRP